MRKNELRARASIKRDLAAIALPTKLQLQKIISELQNMVYSAVKTGETDDIERICRERLLALLNAGTEVAVLKGGRRGQLSSEKVIDEPIKEIMPVRFSLQDSGTIQAQGTAAYLKRISGIDPTKTNNEFRKQNAVLINGLSKEISDTIKKTIVDLTKMGVHVKGGKKEVSDILLNAGLDPAAVPRLAETIFRTQTAAAYNAGRWNIVNDSDTAPYIWGFQYCTAHDRRVRPEHRLLEGVRLPKDDPFWKRYFPPNGWNCRCTVLEIWNDEDIAKEDYGITGVDPRTRTDQELNLLPAFDGNVGILGYGRGGYSGKAAQKQQEAKYVPIEYKQIESNIEELNNENKGTKTVNLIVDEVYNSKGFVIKTRDGEILCEIQQKGVSFDNKQKKWRSVFQDGISKLFYSVKEALVDALSELARKLKIKLSEILLSYKTKKKVSTDSIFPDDLQTLKVIRTDIGGSTGAKLVEDDTGQKMIMKTSNKVPVEHVENEARADEFYRAMGIDVPQFRLYKNPDGSVTKLAEFIEGGTTLNDWWDNATQKERDKMRTKLLKGFAVDVILNARDVVGANGDNVLVDKDGNPWRIDNGGTMNFRAQGAKHAFEDWEAGMPNELLTMTDDNFGAVKQKYFGKVSLLEAIRMIDQRSQAEWDKAIDVLPPEDQAIVRKRLSECRQLLVRADDLTANKFTEKSTNNILVSSYELSRDGFREAVPDLKDLGTYAGAHVDFGFFRSSNSSAVPAGIMYQGVWDAILDAVKTVNFNNAPGGNQQPNKAKIKEAKKHKKDMTAKAKAGDQAAAKYLDYIKKIEKAYKNGTTIPETFTPATVSGQTTTNQYIYSSLTDWLHTKINKDGGNAHFIIDWQGAQAGDSYSENSCKWKIVKGICQGIDINQPEDKILKEFRKRGFYIGNKKLGGIPEVQEDSFIKALRKLQSDPDIEKRIKTAETYMGGIQLILENCEFPGNDKATRTVVCCRTEEDTVVGQNVIDTFNNDSKGRLVKCTHNPGVAESHSVKWVFAYRGHELTSVKVPYSRISGIYFLERKPGDGDGCFLGDRENEINAQTNGLLILYQGQVSGGEDFEPYRTKHITAENKGKGNGWIEAKKNP